MGFLTKEEIIKEALEFYMQWNDSMMSTSTDDEHRKGCALRSIACTMVLNEMEKEKVNA